MKKKWIGLFLSLLLLTGSIAPNAYAVTQSSTSDELKTEHTTETSTQPMSESTTHESTNDSLPQDSAKEEDSGEYSENNEITEKIEINKSNFPDDHFRNWLLEMIDTDKDGYLSNELLEVTQLNLEGLQIQTLKGVNFFKNLTKIEVQNNELKELDVHELKKLAYLDVSSNQLSKIDLSQNSELTYFKGENQTVTSIANKMDNKWEINDETLKPEKEQTILETEKWQYDGNHFYSSEQTPLSYIYEVDFSDDAVLEEAAEKTLTVKVTVEYMEPEQKEADSIVPDSSSIVLKKGETKQLEYTSVPDGSIISDPLWESSDPSVIEVDENGKVTAKEAGEAKVELKNAEKVLGEFTVIVEAEKNESQTKETAQTSDETTDRSPIYRRSALAATPTITYQTHVKNIGWQENQTNGATAGTTGRNLWIEAIKLSTSGTGVTGDIEYSSHIKNIGWQDYVKNGETSGTTGRVLQMEAIKIRLTGQLAQTYDVYYRVHSANFGWLGWAKNGENAGTAGYVYQMEAIQVQLVRKEATGPVTGNAFIEKGKNNPVISYQSFVKDQGWQENQTNGATSGTTGQNLWIEAMRMQISDTTLTGDIEYSAHVKNIGWQNYVKNNEIAGTTDRYAQIEAMRVRLTGQLSQYYNVYYRVHSANFGWLGWARNGENAGTAGFVYQVEAVEVQLVPKGQAAPGTGTAFYDKNTLQNPTINYQAHLRNIGWQSVQSNGNNAGLTRQSARVEALRINVANTPLPGAVEYTSHVQNIGWQNYSRNNEISGTTGRALHTEAVRIRLTGQLNRFYDIYYRVHSARLGWLDWAKNDQYAGTSRLNLPMEAIQVVIVKKGAAAPGPTTNPYQTSINHLFVMGHGVNDPGASYSGVNERDFTRGELMPHLQRWAARLTRNRITFYNTAADMYQDSQRMQGAYTISSSFSSVSEFHLDSGVIGVSTGGHVIAHRNGNSLTAQNYAIANVIRNYVGLWGSVQNTGGINLRADLLNMNVLQSRGIPYRLAELGFITNTNDVANIRNNIDMIAKGIVESVTGENL